MKPKMSAEQKAVRLCMVWAILVYVAQNGLRPHYGQLGDVFGVLPVNVARDLLNPVRRFCTNAGVPDLTCLVVPADKKPGKDNPHGNKAEWDRKIREVIKYDWRKAQVPTPADFMS